ncbi:MAG: hypothetical protein ACE5I9_04485 [Candidatus Methylomirabilales bacterium]
MKTKQRVSWWRRSFYVHPIQRKYFFLSLVPLIVCAFLLIFLVFIPLNLALLGPAPDPEKAAILGQIYALAVRIWPAVLISMLVSGLLSFFVTHKFAGPLYRIEQVVRRIAEGDLPLSIRVRRHDDLQEFAALLDGAFGTITSALTAIREQEALAAKELTALQGNVKAGLKDAGGILQGLEVMGRRHREVENILANFRLPARSGDEGRQDRAA